mgnify:CR=1 FL=1
MSKEFYIFITFDVDQDFSLNNNNYDNREYVEFEGYKEGLPLVIDELHGKSFSVFMRADSQINDIYGSYSYLLDGFDIPDYIVNNNGEINWHTHLYDNSDKVYSPVYDFKRTVELFERDYENVKNIININSKILRIGECYMNNELMASISRFGVLIDSTALPGRKRDDKDRQFDWGRTGNRFYYPSVFDYQLPGEPSYNILEVPMTTIKMKTNYDNKYYFRYFNLAFKTDVLFENLPEYIRNNDHLITITHPYEVLSKGDHGLISYNIKVFKDNLCRLIEMVEKNNKTPIFKKIGDLNCNDTFTEQFL